MEKELEKRMSKARVEAGGLDIGNGPGNYSEIGQQLESGYDLDIQRNC